MPKKVREFRSLVFRHFDTEAEFARKIGWNKQKLNKISNGETVPSIADLALMAPELHTSTGILADIFLHYMSPNEQQNAS